MFPMKCKQRERWTNVDTKTLRQKRDSIRLITERTCNRHTGGEILIRVRAVMFKHSDNILLHAFTGPAFVGKELGVGPVLKNSTYCIMYKGPSRKHKN